MRIVMLGALCALAMALSGCSREQADWEKARTANNTDSYELFIKKYPAGEFSAQAQARVKELYEERDWQKARDADTLEAYQSFLKGHPEGKWTEEARIRVENFSLAQTPNGPPSGGAPGWEPSPPAAAPNPKPAPPAAPPPAKSMARKPSVTATVAGASADKSAGGAYGVQLGAFNSGAAAANRRWAALQTKYPTVLAGLEPRVTAANAATGNLHRLQVLHLSKTKARSICRELKAKSQACVLLLPAKAT